jgi:hypothetical protein
MAGIRGILLGIAGILLVLAITACQATLSNVVPPLFGSRQTIAVSEGTTVQHTEDVVWGKVPYCNCLATSATANVANALQEADIAFSIKEVSPSDGWLYFVVDFDLDTASVEQVRVAIEDGGGDWLEGPP